MQKNYVNVLETNKLSNLCNNRLVNLLNSSSILSHIQQNTCLINFGKIVLFGLENIKNSICSIVVHVNKVHTWFDFLNRLNG